MRATLSVCLITLNEEHRLPAALSSVSGLADEILVVDSGSQDRTRDLAEAMGATVIEHEWAGFAAQRNVALDHAGGDWVLELDADERVTTSLASEIRAFLAAPPSADVSMALLPMRHRFLGRMLGPAGHYPFYRSRLFRRGEYRHDASRSVHEGLWPQEIPWVLEGDLAHELAGSLHEAVRDSWAYARLSASVIPGVSARQLVIGTVMRPPAKFLYGTVLLGGWRDGVAGMIRIALECLSDAATWVLARRHSGVQPGIDRHFGRPARHVGPVHLLAVGNPSRHRGWLESAVAAGALVSVVCSARHAESRLTGAERLRIRTVPRLGPVQLLRAIDAEAQVVPIAAYVALDRSGALMLRAVPGVARIEHPGRMRATELVSVTQAGRPAESR